MYSRPGDKLSHSVRLESSRERLVRNGDTETYTCTLTHIYTYLGAFDNKLRTNEEKTKQMGKKMIFSRKK